MIQNMSLIHNVEKISGSKWSIKVTDHFTCTSAKVIHCITCTFCKKLYIGETERSLGDQFWKQGKMTKTHLNRLWDALVSPIILRNIWQSAALPYIKEAWKAAKLWNINLFFKSALLILTVSTNAFLSTNLFCCFSHYHAPTNSVVPSFCIQTTHNPQLLNLLWQRATPWNDSF